MSNESDLHNKNINFDRMRKLLSQKNSFAAQTNREEGYYYDENLFNNMLYIMKNEKISSENHLIQILDKIKANNNKFNDGSKNKYKKFVNFIKVRLFKSFSSKNKKFCGYIDYNSNVNQHKGKKINPMNNLFLTQDTKKLIVKPENKLMILYKKIFENGLDEAKVYNNIRLVPLIEEIPDVKKYIDNIDNNEINNIETRTGINFFSKYKTPQNDHVFRLMKNRTFINFRTNPALKKGHLIKNPISKMVSGEELRISKEQINENDIFYKTSNLPKFNCEIEEFKSNNNKTYFIKTNYSSPNAFKVDIPQNFEIKKNKKFIYSNLITANENSTKPINSNICSSNTSHFFIKNEKPSVNSEERFVSSVNKSRSNHSSKIKYSQLESDKFIKSKKMKFSTIINHSSMSKNICGNIEQNDKMNSIPVKSSKTSLIIPNNVKNERKKPNNIFQVFKNEKKDDKQQLEM